MPNLNTDEWNLKTFCEYVPVVKWKNVECPKCGGNGRTNMHFGSLDEPETCWDCHGSGAKSVQEHPKTTKPTVPQDFLDWMTKCYLEYKLK